MRRSEARVALEAARRWNGRGLFQPGAFEHIERELREAAREDEPSLATQTFYAVGGLMLGAATAALYALLQFNDVLGDAESTTWGFFALCALVLLGVGAVLLVGGQRDLGDAILLAGLVPTAITLGPQSSVGALWFLPPLVGLGVVAARRGGHVLPLVGLALALVALPVALYRTLQDDAASFWWLLAAVAAFAGTLAWNRVAAPAWGDEAAFGTTLSVAGAWLGVVLTALQPDFDAAPEVLLGFVLLVLLGVGILLRQRAVVFASAAALTVDAIVFAFDLGGPTTGLVVLLALAAGLITSATVLRRRRARAEPS